MSDIPKAREPSLFHRACAALLPKLVRDVPEPDLEANDRILAETPANDPKLQCFLQHQLAQFKNSLELALDLGDVRTDDIRLRHVNEARAHLRGFLDLESRREGWERTRAKEAEGKKRG